MLYYNHKNIIIFFIKKYQLFYVYKYIQLKYVYYNNYNNLWK